MFYNLCCNPFVQFEFFHLQAIYLKMDLKVCGGCWTVTGLNQQHHPPT